MDKQEAIAFIQRELQNNCSQEEIVSLLSLELGAPPDVVRKFVAQVAAQQKPPAPTAPKVNAAAPTPYDEALPSFAPDSDVLPPSPANVPARPIFQVPPSVSPSPYTPPVIPGAVSANPLQGNTELEKWTLSALSKNRVMNDIVMHICEETGASWDQAQRFVAQVRMANRKTLTTRQNIMPILLSIMAILAGIALFGAGVNEVKEVIQYYINPAAYPNGLTSDIDRLTIAAIASGPVLFFGGIVGLFLSLKKQFE